MKRFKTIDWLNIVAPMLLGVLLSFQFNAWWLLLILAGVLYGSFMWRMTAVIEEMKELSEGLTDISRARTKSLREIRLGLKNEERL